MTEGTKALEVQEPELAQIEGTERMRAKTTYIPRTDIYETDESVVLILDMPGMSEESIDITLENNILAITGNSMEIAPEGYALVFAEYEPGDFERSFRLTDQIDRDGIQAAYRDGVLSLTLPKAEKAKARKIQITTG